MESQEAKRGSRQCSNNQQIRSFGKRRHDDDDDDDGDIDRVWETIREDIQISAKEDLG
jgi:hypothetical protein